MKSRDEDNNIDTALELLGHHVSFKMGTKSSSDYDQKQLQEGDDEDEHYKSHSQRGGVSVNLVHPHMKSSNNSAALDLELSLGPISVT